MSVSGVGRGINGDVGSIAIRKSVEQATNLNPQSLQREAKEVESVFDSIQDEFISYDRNRDNKLEVKEVAEVLQAEDPRISKTEIQELFSSADSNGDGRVSGAEFKNAVVSSEDEFDSFDSDRSDHLSLNELVNLVHAENPSISKTEIQQLFDSVDTNEDGQISRQEFEFADPSEDDDQSVEITQKQPKDLSPIPEGASGGAGQKATQYNKKDLNKDGTVTKREEIQYLLNQIAQKAKESKTRGSNQEHGNETQSLRKSIDVSV